VTDTDALIAEARTHLGGEPGPLRVGRDPVNQAMINHWVQALDDQNPAYTDPSVRGHVISPPGMLQTWTMDAPRDPDGTASNDAVNRLLDEAGYTSVVAVNYEHEYLRELTLGERLSVRSTAEDLSEEKKTALGLGRFTTVKHEYLTDDGEVVCVARMRLLKFKPPAAAPLAPELGARPTPAIGRDNEFFWDGVAAGELRIGSCNACGTLHHPPQPICRSCGSTDMGYVVSSGTGVVYSHVTHHYPRLPGVELPHTVLLVELEEGVRFVSEWAAGAAPETTFVGQPVQVAFTPVPGGELRPTFKAVS
jgi:uncharacterized OB-fold protein